MSPNSTLFSLITLTVLLAGQPASPFLLQTPLSNSPPSVRQTCLYQSRKTVLTEAPLVVETISSDSTLDASPEEQTQAPPIPSLEKVDWDWISVAKSVFEGSDKRPVILFDGVCNLCNGGVNFALDNDRTGNFRFVSLQSRVGKSLLLRCGKRADDISSIVLVTGDGVALFKSDAILRIARGLDNDTPLPAFGWVGPMFPSFFRDWVYDVVADNRYRLGEREAPSCRLDFDGSFEKRFIPDPDETI